MEEIQLSAISGIIASRGIVHRRNHQTGAKLCLETWKCRIGPPPRSGKMIVTGASREHLAVLGGATLSEPLCSTTIRMRASLATRRCLTLIVAWHIWLLFYLS